jgi:hypothetical protein
MGANRPVNGLELLHHSQFLWREFLDLLTLLGPDVCPQSGVCARSGIGPIGFFDRVVVICRRRYSKNIHRAKKWKVKMLTSLEITARGKPALGQDFEDDRLAGQGKTH